MKMIDLRSDTVTKPSAAMREAMANAAVGDDVYGEDPTVNQLEERSAEVFGKEAAIYVPSGTMGNQIAIRLHTQHGQEVICESRAHVLDWEMGMIAAFSGCTTRTVVGHCGVMRWEQIEAAIAPPLYYRAQTGLIALENSHNMAGGTVYPMEVLEEIWAGAKEVGLPVHLDGARVFNAAVAMGVSVAEATRGFETVSFCLSKGLGAPVGSVLVGSKEQILRAKSFRKALGGGMRQVGILAAAGLMALEEGPKRLYRDHESARRMAEMVAESDAVEIDLASVQTNIVLFRLREEGRAPGLVAALKEQGILSSAIGPNHVRLVTHCDVSFEDCEWSAKVLVGLLANVAA